MSDSYVYVYTCMSIQDVGLVHEATRPIRIRHNEGQAVGGKGASNLGANGLT